MNYNEMRDKINWLYSQPVDADFLDKRTRIHLLLILLDIAESLDGICELTMEANDA